MRTRFMKPVLFGTLAVVASAIVAGPAFGRVFIPNTSQNQGSPPSQQAQQSNFIPGYTDFPNVLRYHSTLTPTERQQLDAAVEAVVSKSVHQPGVTSGPAALPPQVMKRQDSSKGLSALGNGEFPNLRRVEGMLMPAERRQVNSVAAMARSIDQQQGSTSFIPGYTDFPNVLRYHSTLTPTERRQLDKAVAEVTAASTASSSGGSGVNWSDAGIGIGIALAIAGGLVIVMIVGIRRDKATPAPA